MRPSDFPINNFNYLAGGNEAICVGARASKKFSNGVSTEEIDGYSYELVLPNRKFEHITLKVPGVPLINPDLFVENQSLSIKVEDIKDFKAKWYKTSTMTDYALSCRASGFTISKEVKA